MTRQARSAGDVREEAYRLALNAARERDADGDPERAGAIRDLAAMIKRIRLTLDVEKDAAVLTTGDVDLNVRTTNILGATSPASLIGDVLDDDTHPLRSKLRVRDLIALAEVREAAGAIRCSM